MDFIFSLAHYCEIHGPTSVICTQALSEPCPASSPRQNGHSPGHAMPSLVSVAPANGDTPAEVSAPSFRGAAEDRADACASCAFDIPEDVTRRLPDSAPGSPVLRTRGSVLAECEHADADTSDDSSHDNLDAALSSARASPASPISAIAVPLRTGHARKSSSVSSTARSYAPGRHPHQLTYLTSRHPAQPSLYTALRHSCIRTLSLENLPRGTPSGPLLFGDPQSGHTIAFIFRLPDPYARGRRRTYALLALNPGRDAARVGRAMARVVALFRQIAAWIVGLAERASEQAAASSDSSGRSDDDLASSDPVVGIHDPDAPPTPTSPDDLRPVSGGGAPPVSSFLSAKRLGADGLPTRRRRIYGSGTGPPDPMSPRAHGTPTAAGVGPKGLPELVGREGLFVELHVAFVRALMVLGREFGSAP